jgi:hypothetical protein
MHATRIPHYHHENFHALTITSRTKTDQVALNDTTLSHTTPNQTQTRAESAPHLSSRGPEEYHFHSQYVRCPGRSSVVAVVVRHHPHFPQRLRATGVDTSSTTGY